MNNFQSQRLAKKISFQFYLFAISVFYLTFSRKMEKSEEKNKYIGLLDFFKNYTIQWKIYPQFNINYKAKASCNI